MGKFKITAKDLDLLNSERGIEELVKRNKDDLKDILKDLKYEEELEKLQIELCKMQGSVLQQQKRIAILFEGRDAAGKGSTIKRFMEYMNPRYLRNVALPKPSEQEKGQWYFQRYIKTLPNAGEIVLYDRSWYNRAVVEPAMGFCSAYAYDKFMEQVIDFEKMLVDDGMIIIKFWLEISREEQNKRFEERLNNPLKQWKYSDVDAQAQERWEIFSHYQQKMFEKTHTSFAPWVLVDSDNKKKTRLETIRYVLSQIDYAEKGEEIDLTVDTKVIKIVGA